MEPEDTWNDPMDDDGVTLGPEEALKREIEKSKRLKVERLKLKDKIETLAAQNAALTRKNEALEETIAALKPQQVGTPPTPQAAPRPTAFGWTLFLLVLNIATLSVLLYFLLLK